MTLGGKLGVASYGKKPRYVLDIGTGTGIWALDFGTHLHLPCYKAIPADIFSR
jgi:ribosomal protein L11 methylase PrmA